STRPMATPPRTLRRARSSSSRWRGSRLPSASRLEAPRRGCGHERLLHPRQHLLTRPLLYRLQAAELEPRKLDPTLRSHRHEAEVGEEVRGEDGAVDVETLEVRLALRVAVGEGLESPRATLA